MLRIRDIMTTPVTTIPAEATLREAMELLAHQHVSGAPVLSGRQVVGVITTTDLMAFTASLAGIPTLRDSERTWEDDAPVPEDDIEIEPDAAFFTELWEDAGAEVSERIESSAGPEWNALEEHDVSEAMTHTPLFSLPSSASVQTAAAMMDGHRIHRVLVIDDGELCGIVSALDIAHAVAERGLGARAS